MDMPLALKEVSVFEEAQRALKTFKIDPDQLAKDGTMTAKRPTRVPERPSELELASFRDMSGNKMIPSFGKHEKS